MTNLVQAQLAPDPVSQTTQ